MAMSRDIHKRFEVVIDRYPGSEPTWVFDVKDETGLGYGSSQHSWDDLMYAINDFFCKRVGPDAKGCRDVDHQFRGEVLPGPHRLARIRLTCTRCGFDQVFKDEDDC
jgi:hypothetical protein